MEKHLAVCPYCGAGCKLSLTVKDGLVVDAQGENGITNEGELCLKGLYGYDFVNDTKILTPRIYHPMIRRTKGAPLERVTWDEALDFTASRLRAIIEESGPEAVMLTGSSRGAGNEANFVMQKFTRACLGTNNIDNCARTCHAASVIGLMECVGSGAMSVSIPTLEETDCILLFGYNPAASHPIVARRIVRAKERGAQLIVCDPRVIESARIADVYLPLRNGSNLALVNALAYTVIDEDLADWDFIDEHTEGFDAWWDVVQDYAPEDVEGVTGLDAELVRQAARRYAQAPSAVLGWGMGVTQQAQGVQTVRALAALALVTGHIGRPNSGLAPVRGQNNVQGSCDMGMWPSLYPGYQRVDDPAVRAKFAAAWGVPEERLSLKEGYKLTRPSPCRGGRAHPRVLQLRRRPAADRAGHRADAAHAGKPRPADQPGHLHDADHGAGRRGAARHLVGRARGRVHRLRPHVPAHDGRLDAQGRMSPATGRSSPTCPAAWAIPCTTRTRAKYGTRCARCAPSSPAPPTRRWTGWAMRSGPFSPMRPTTRRTTARPNCTHGGAFTTPDGKGTPGGGGMARRPRRQPDDALPAGAVHGARGGALLVPVDDGQLQGAGRAGRRARLREHEPGRRRRARHPAKRSLVWVHSRRGKVLARAAVDERVNEGAVYMTYQWWIGKCNELTLHATDGESGTPEDKYSACEVEAIADQAWAERHLLERYVALKEHLAKEAAAQDAVDAEGAADAGAVVVAAGAEGCDGLGSSEVAGVGVGSVAGSSLCGGKAEAGSLGAGAADGTPSAPAAEESDGAPSLRYQVGDEETLV